MLATNSLLGLARCSTCIAHDLKGTKEHPNATKRYKTKYQRTTLEGTHTLVIEDLSLHSHRVLISIPGQHGLTIDLLEGFFRTFISSGHAMSCPHLPRRKSSVFQGDFGRDDAPRHLRFQGRNTNWCSNWVTHAIYRDMQSRKPLVTLVTTSAEDRAIRANVRPIQRCLGLQQSFRSERSALHISASHCVTVTRFSHGQALSLYQPTIWRHL